MKRFFLLFGLLVSLGALGQSAQLASGQTFDAYFTSADVVPQSTVFTVEANLSTDDAYRTSAKAENSVLSSPASIDLNGLTNTLKIAAKTLGKSYANTNLSDIIGYDQFLHFK